MSPFGQFSIWVMILSSLCCTEAAIVVNTPAGDIAGTTERVTVSGTNYTFNRFMGIPYAKPPVGDLRFAKPEATDPFTSTFNASALGPACLQLPIPGVEETLNFTSEDCLFLNVFAPNQPADSSAGHAVMVFVHGGGFVAGASDYYEAGGLASYGNVIVVTINYRLGFYGFFTTGDAHVPGNAGFWDQQLAFIWVQNNIQAFGGDKQRVTIFGESAGAISVMMQALYPGNRGLFHRVIAESGAPSTLETLTPERGHDISRRISEKLSCPITSSAEIVNCLRSKSVQELTTKFLELAMSSTSDDMLITQFMPAVDGEFIKIAPKEIAKHPDVNSLEEVQFYRSIDVIAGYNLYEGATYVGSAVAVGNPEGFSPTREEMKSDLIPTAIYLTLGVRYPDLVLTLIHAEYTDWIDPNNPETIRMQYIKMAGDLSFGVSTLAFAALHDDGNSTGYLYHFRPKPSAHVMPTPTWVDGANHGDEEPYVFNFMVTYDSFGNDSSRELWEYVLSYDMMKFWSNFAKSGNPNEPVSVTPDWPKYNRVSRDYLEFNYGKHVAKQNLESKEANFWLNVVPTMTESLSSIPPCETDVSAASLAQAVVYVVMATLIVSLFS